MTKRVVPIGAAPVLDAHCDSRWEKIPACVALVEQTVAAGGAAPEVIESVAMIARELLENASKYGSYARPSDRIQVRVFSTGGAWAVRVSSPVGQRGATNLPRLKETLRYIDTAASPQQAYMQRLMKVANEGDSLESGLGLLRIAYEGDADITSTQDGDLLSVTAVQRSGSQAQEKTKR